MRKPGLANNSFDFGPQIMPDADLMLRTLRSADSITPGELGARAEGDVVKVWVQALPGAGGVLTTPLSGQRCVWFRSVFAPVPSLRNGSSYLPDISSSDCGPVVGTGIGTVRQSLNASEEISTAPFVVGEVGGAQLLVDPLAADVLLDQPTHRRWWRGRMRISGAAEIEWSVPPGTPVLVMGRIGAHGRLVSDEGAGLLISSMGEDEVVARFERDRGKQQMNRFVVRSRRLTRRLGRGIRYLIAGMVVAVVLVVVIQSVLV